MKFSCLILLLPLLLWAGALSAEPAGPPAGITLYAVTPQGVKLLLADHTVSARIPARGWSSFGGSHEAGETPIQTAARETEEETHGYFKRQDLEKALAGQEPAVDGVYHQFFLEVPFVEITELLKVEIPETHSFQERGPFAWIPLSEILPYLEGREFPKEAAKIQPRYLPAGGQTDWLWSTWLRNLRQAREARNPAWSRMEAAHLAATSSR